MKRVAISGCGGYVGNVLARYLLERGYIVKAMDNFHKGHCDALIPLVTNPNFEFIYGDVTREEDCKKLVENVDAIVHLAAIVGFPACARQPALSWAVNVNGTGNMLTARQESKSPNIPFVFASTGSVYGKVVDTCTENTPTNPQSTYGEDKLKAEYAVTGESYTTSLRFATGFGVSPCMRANLLVNDLVYQAIHNKSFTLFEADAKRTFIHVYDMARCFEWAMLSTEKTQRVFNAGDGQLNWSKRQLAEYIKAKTKCHVTYADIAKDADARDYEVDYSAINKAGFYCQYTMEKGINELLRAAPMLRTRNPYD